MKKNISMKDIAQQLGVSTALVSYVLNGQLEDRINKDTAQKIKKLADELGYRPNHVAKSLKINKTLTIGLILADISNPFSASLARIVEDEAKKHNYTVIFGSADESTVKSEDLIRTLMSRRVDGFIIAAPEGSEELLISLKKQAIPFVLVDRYFPDLNVNTVTINNFQASMEAINHLLGQGFSQIGMINLKADLFHLAERSRGYKAALINAGQQNEGKNLKEVEEKNMIAEVHQAINGLLNQADPIQAIFFGNNNLAIEGLIHIRSLNIRIPEDLAIVCFDESNAYNLFYCPITYIRQPLNRLGQAAVKLLLENLGNEERSTNNIILEAELIIQKSSANAEARRTMINLNEI